MDTMASDTRPADNSGTRPAVPATKERRPFLKLSPLLVPREVPEELAPGLEELEHRVGDDVQIVVRSLVNFTVSRQIVAQRAAGRAVGVPHGVLNRRRRSAREWILAIVAGHVDESTLHSLTHTWIPQLAGTGPDVAAAIAPGAEMIEFVRGAISALVMNDFAANLVPHAKALNALETVLSLHLRGLRDAADRG
jgi:hypothetical protein